MTYEAHIYALARQYGIMIVERKGANGRAFSVGRLIKIAPVRGPVSYAVALHEIGHLVAQGASGRKYRRLDKEIAAWKWAKWAALEWSERMDRCLADALQGYVVHAERRHWPIPKAIYQLIEG